MRYLPNGAQMKEADRYTIEKEKVPSSELMRRAAEACVSCILEREYDLTNVLIVCGRGNNGGDGLVMAEILREKGCHVTVYQVNDSSGDEYPQGEYSIIVDALFGVGLNRPVQGIYAETIERMNASSGIKVAVDIPSGISADSGCVLGTAFWADLTVTFQEEKVGLVLYSGRSYAGEVVVADIGIQTKMYADNKKVAYSLDREDYRKLLPKRYAESHKGTYGRLLVIAGSEGMSGAAYLNAAAAYRTGAGLVQIYTPKENRIVLQTLLPEAIVTTYETYEEEKVKELLDQADAICIGSGLGTGKRAKKMLRTVLREAKVPCVIDADGLNLMSEHREYMEMLKSGQYVLTPHMKEMSRLTDIGVERLKRERIPILEEFVQEYQCTCVLKDACTVAAFEGARTYVNGSGNEAMAKGGSGDVLAGVISGLLAQKVSEKDAAVLGVYVHGRSGDLARKELGSYSVLATDLIRKLSSVWKEEEEIRDEELHKNSGTGQSGRN